MSKLKNAAFKEKHNKLIRKQGKLTLRCSEHPYYKGEAATKRRWCSACTILRHIHTNSIPVNVNIDGDISHLLRAGARKYNIDHIEKTV